ncbi:MAG TPA: glycosyltransferase family 1 protein [Paludibaculum sp.]|jgi:alpha-1,3-rhamnosyl/mannosyltransferase
MKIAIDATALLLRSAGVKSVLYHWLRALQDLAGADSVVAYPPMPELGGLDHEGSVAGRWPTLRGIVMAVANQRLGVPFPQWCTRGADVFHSSNQVRTPPRGMKLTATIHDMTCWKMPELHTAANVVADKRYAEKVLRRADGLIAVSEYSRRDAIELLGLRPEKIVAIPNGVSEEYFRAAPMRRAKPYVLTVGTIEPRKNIDRLLDAWEALRPELRAEYELIVAGPAGWASAPTIARLQSQLEGVRWLGYVAEKDLPSLTAGAAVLAYPSLYEGFGLPLAEAMAAGVPCVTSNVSSMPEVAGEGARFVDPLSVAELSGALAGLLENADERARLGRAGRARAAALYRWPLVAERSLEFFRGVIGS